VIHYLPEDLPPDARDLALRGRIDGIEQRRKRVAQVEAAPTAVADVEYALEFFLERA
jgi:hypothetical protein